METASDVPPTPINAEDAISIMYRVSIEMSLQVVVSPQRCVHLLRPLSFDLARTILADFAECQGTGTLEGTLACQFQNS